MKKQFCIFLTFLIILSCQSKNDIRNERKNMTYYFDNNKKIINVNFDSSKSICELSLSLNGKVIDKKRINNINKIFYESFEKIYTERVFKEINEDSSDYIEGIGFNYQELNKNNYYQKSARIILDKNKLYVSTYNITECKNIFINNTEIQIEYWIWDRLLKILLIDSNKHKDSIIYNDVTNLDLDSFKIISQNKLLFSYEMRGGTGVMKIHTSILTIVKNKLIESFNLSTIAINYLFNRTVEDSFSLKFNSNYDTLLLNQIITDESKNKKEVFYNKYILKYDSLENVYYNKTSSYKKQKKYFIITKVYDNGINKKEYVNRRWEYVK